MTSPKRASLAVALALASGASACRRTIDRGGELHAQKVVLTREVEGLRGLADRLRGGGVPPPDDVVVVVEDALVRDLLNANLPFETVVDKYQIKLDCRRSHLPGQPAHRAGGLGHAQGGAGVQGDVRVLGALEKIRVDPATGGARSVAVDRRHAAPLRLRELLPGAGLERSRARSPAARGAHPRPGHPREGGAADRLPRPLLRSRAHRRRHAAARDPRVGGLRRPRPAVGRPLDPAGRDHQEVPAAK